MASLFLGAFLYFVARRDTISILIVFPNSTGGVDMSVDPSSLSVCWVTSLQEGRFKEFCVGVFSFLSTLEETPPFKVMVEVYFYQGDGRHFMSAGHIKQLQCLSLIRPDIHIRHHFINQSFINPLRREHAGGGFMPVVFVRLFLLFEIESAWVLYLDADAVVVHPFLSELRPYLFAAPNAPIFAVLDVQAYCPWSPHWRAFYEGRQRITHHNKNSTLYFNSGFMVYRNSHVTKQMMRHVIDMISRLRSGFTWPTQDSLWAFTKTSLYGVLPKKFNCMTHEVLCPGFVCPPNTSIFHGHRTPAMKHTERAFTDLLRKMIQK
jgi:hypothetical protein